MKYCCDHFNSYCEVRNELGPNIRIVKFISPSLTSGWSGFNIEMCEARKKSKRKDLGFFITFGYEKFSFGIAFMVINYCPHCGTNLYKFYDKDEYVHEIEGETFTL